ncbi:MAG TPA: hypothetical protein VFV67_18555 [Actinophytocola sp.]|uniref:hypothetical protein n=1 Tax=Actinophytocola sp. TaxID=1872138 RepID=UPI002DB9945A|nr:hypothetical protein [Actinophytocola sp.]HEU5472652.1 hypothetical protein [Actinophytocola sp.]
MDTALWIGGAALAGLLVLLVAWRLRRAARTMRRILDEERERTLTEGDDERIEDPQRSSRGQHEG